ncbi:unnamed protein product [Gordionus sp. m RMFG-2023]|uniref:muscle-specific protein 20-like isoform X2 n=1 Tax=Gordionus sp. m RMFG-2023 TaxID=3053472 RepID=UPI0030E01041
MNKGPSYGLSAAVAAKIASKRDTEQEESVKQWISTVLKDEGFSWKGTYDEQLKDGQVLCRIMNKLQPGIIKKINSTGGDFKMMENITNFQKAAREYGLPDLDVFQTVDLWDRRNISQVTQCIFALGRVAQTKPGYNYPILGPRLSDENKRNFSNEQMRAGEGIINLQMGSNKGATQKGMNFGNTRHI